jgi:hypothetical protein
MSNGDGGVGGAYSGLKLSAPNGVKVYQVTSGKEVPAWLSERNARKLRKDADYQKRIELIQDLEFSTAASRVKLSPDGRRVGAALPGVHVIGHVDRTGGCMDRTGCRQSVFVSMRPARVAVARTPGRCRIGYMEPQYLAFIDGVSRAKNNVL